MTAAITAEPAVEFELPMSEEQVLGAALHGDPAGLDRLVPDDFTDPRRRALAETIKRLQSSGAPVDAASVVAAIIASPEVRWTAGRSIGVHVADLVDGCAVVASGTYHARLVAGASARRRLVRLAAEVEDIARTAEVEAIVGRLELLVAEVAAAVGRVIR